VVDAAALLVGGTDERGGERLTVMVTMARDAVETSGFGVEFLRAVSAASSDPAARGFISTLQAERLGVEDADRVTATQELCLAVVRARPELERQFGRDGLPAAVAPSICQSRRVQGCRREVVGGEKDGGSWNAICGVWQKCRGSYNLQLGTPASTFTLSEFSSIEIG